MINLLKTINDEQMKIKSQLEADNEQVEFFKNFLKNNFLNIRNIFEIDKCDLAIAVIMATCPDLEFEYVKSAVYENSPIFKKFQIEDFLDIFNAIGNLEDDGHYEKLKANLITGKRTNLLGFLSKVNQEAKYIEAVLNEENIAPQSLVKFMELLRNKESNEGLTDATSVTSALIQLEDEYAKYQTNFQEMIDWGVVSIRKKDEQKIVDAAIKKTWNIENLLKPIRNARVYGLEKEKEAKSKQRVLLKQKAEYETFATKIYNLLQETELINADTLISKIPSEIIRIQALKLIYKHNKDIYDKTASEYRILSANDASHYQVLLAKYGISPEIYEVGTVMRNSIEDVEKMLKQIKKMQITTPEEILRVVQESNLETINAIYALQERGVINNSLFSKHKNIFNPLTNEYENLMRNIKLFSDKNINPRYIRESQETLVTPHQIFKENIDTLEDYNLLSLMRGGISYSFLAKQNVASAIDVLLELGYEKNLEENLDLLNYKDNFGRLKLLKSLNIPITATERLLEVLTTTKFIMADDEIDNYIYNAVDYKLPSVVIQSEDVKRKSFDKDKLKEYEHTSRTYSFDGVLISINKVNRNLSSVASTNKPTDRLLYGVINGSVLTDEELSKIKGALSNKNSNTSVKQKTAQ